MSIIDKPTRLNVVGAAAAVIACNDAFSYVEHTDGVYNLPIVFVFVEFAIAYEFLLQFLSAAAQHTGKSQSEMVTKF